MQLCDCKKQDYTDRYHKANYGLHWSFGNGKLAKDGIVSFGLPAFKAADGFTVCPSASVCALVCYARQGHYMMGHVQQAREHNLTAVRSSEKRPREFVNTAVKDILAFRPHRTKVRIHDSGDFFTENYLLSWIIIAREMKHVDFYGYTKMISWAHETRHLWPVNFHLVQSVGGLEDSSIDPTQSHSIIFPTHEALLESGYEDASVSDKPAYERAVKVGLSYHGVAKLTVQRANLLTVRNLPILSS